MRPPERICVVGLWHLGCVVAACWAELGHQVIGLDTNATVVEGLSRGRAPIYEPGLDALIQNNVAAGRLSFTGDFAKAADGARVAFLTFDTPVDANDRSDLQPLEHALRTLAPLLPPAAVVVVSSQVPVGTCGRWRQNVRTANRDVDLVYSPENLRLGEAIDCYLRPDRIVLGADSQDASRRVAGLFEPMAAPVLTMSLASAEMAKHGLNGFLAASVSFINEIATLCEASGADVLDVVRALKSDPRIGPR